MTSRTLPSPTIIEAWRARVGAICTDFPETTAPPPINGHSAYEVRGKKFAYYLIDHHGDGRVAINCKAEAGVQGLLIDADPSRFYVPAYLGPRGWIGLDFVSTPPDWDEVARLLLDSYVLVAPRKLAALATPRP